MNLLRKCIALPLRFQYTKPHDIIRYSSANHPFRFTEVEDRWKRIDGIPKNWKLIYKTPMDKLTNYISSYLTLSTGFVTVAGAYYAYFNYDVIRWDDPILFREDIVIAENLSEFMIYIVAYFGFHAVLKTFLTRFLIRLYKNGDNYIAIFRGNFYNTTVRHEFNLHEFQQVNRSFYFVPWGSARFTLGKKHAIILDSYFKTPQYFNYLVFKKKPALEDDDDDD